MPACTDLGRAELFKAHASDVLLRGPGADDGANFLRRRTTVRKNSGMRDHISLGGSGGQRSGSSRRCDAGLEAHKITASISAFNPAIFCPNALRCCVASALPDVNSPETTASSLVV